MISFNWTISRELALSFVASLRRMKKTHQVPAQDSGSLDQNIQLIRSLFCSSVGHSFDDVFHCRPKLWDTHALGFPPSVCGCRFS